MYHSPQLLLGDSLDYQLPNSEGQRRRKYAPGSRVYHYEVPSIARLRHISPLPPFEAEEKSTTEEALGNESWGASTDEGRDRGLTADAFAVDAVTGDISVLKVARVLIHFSIYFLHANLLIIKYWMLFSFIIY